MMHVQPCDAPADLRAFVMRDTPSRPEGSSCPGFRGFIQPTLTARSSRTWTGSSIGAELDDKSSRGRDVPPRSRRDGNYRPLHRSRSPIPHVASMGRRV